MIGHMQTLILKVEAVAHTAAVQTAIGEQALQILQDGIVLLLVQVLRRGLRIVIAELDGDIVGQETLHISGQLVHRVLPIQHAVDAGAAGDLTDDLVGGFLHILHQMAGDVHTSDLVLVLLGEGQHLLGSVILLHGEGGVDVDLVGGGHGVQHLLQRLQIGQRLAAGEHEVTVRGDGIHHADALDDLLQRKTAAIGIFLFIDTEGAVIVAVVGNENCNGCAAFAGLIGVTHQIS